MKTKIQDGEMTVRRSLEFPSIKTSKAALAEAIVWADIIGLRRIVGE